MRLDAPSPPGPPPAGAVRGARRRVSFALALLAAAALACLEARSIYGVYLAHERLPLWDMAGHGWGGVELLEALAQGRPLDFLARADAQDTWPFGFSLLLLPFLAAGGASFASATLLATVLFAATAPLLVWAGREIDDGPAGLWAGLLAGALLLASPLFRLYGILVMRETAGAALSLLAFCLYLRARRLADQPGTTERARLAGCRAAGLAALAVFFVKYNYGLAWWLAVGVCEALRLGPAGRRELAARLAGRLRQGGLRAVAAALAFVLAGVGLAAGANVGPALWAALVAATVALARAARRDPARLRAAFRALPPGRRAVLETVVAPLWLWSLSPSHLKEVVAFLRNRSTGLPLAEGLLFPLRALVDDWAPDPRLALPLAAGIGLAFVGLRRAAPLRALAVTAGLGLALAAVHPYKEARFLAAWVPFLALLAALGGSRALHALGRGRWRTAAGSLLSVAATAAVVALVALAHAPAARDRLVAGYRLHSADPALAEVLAFVGQHAAPGARVAVIGGFNELSPSLVRWWLAQGPGGAARLVRPPSRRAGEPPREAARTHLDRWLAAERPARVVAIRLLPRSPLRGEDFRRHNAWQLPVIAALRREPGWAVAARRRFRPLALEVLVLDRRPSLAACRHRQEKSTHAAFTLSAPRATLVGEAASPGHFAAASAARKE